VEGGRTTGVDRFRSSHVPKLEGGSKVKDCLFCEIIRGEKPAEFAYRDDVLVAFKDIHPKAPVHLLLVPRRHIRSINDLTEDDREVVSEIIFKAAAIARGLGIERSGYKLKFNVERGGGQLIFHLHLHLLGGW
jgi:histidine triad (HIT) family protein